jgi:WD40 repeat protein
VLVLDSDRKPAAIAFTSDGTRLVAAMVGGSAPEVWTLATGQRLRTNAELSGHWPSLSVHPSGRCAFVANRALTVIPLDGGKPKLTAFKNVDYCIVSPRGEWVVAATNEAPNYRSLSKLHCTLDGKLSIAWQNGDFYTPPLVACGFTADGEQFITLENGQVVVRTTKSGLAVARCKYPSHYVNSWAVSPDGSRFAAMGYDKLYLWDTASWGTPTRVSGLNRWINSMAFHPTRPIILATQDRLSLVKYLNAETGKPIRKFDWRLGDMKSVAFSPDGALAAAGSVSGGIANAVCKFPCRRRLRSQAPPVGARATSGTRRRRRPR